MSSCENSKSHTTQLCPITPHMANLHPITHHADNLGPITHHGKPQLPVGVSGRFTQRSVHLIAVHPD